MEAREQFFQIASHDLKNPLTSIMGASTIVGDCSNVGDPITAELQHIMRTILNRAREMQRIIEDYLDLHAMEDGKLAVKQEPIDLAELARSASGATAMMRNASESLCTARPRRKAREPVEMLTRSCRSHKT